MDDDEAIGHEQARRLRATMVAAGIDRGRLWLSYFSIGGEASELEVDAYLHHSLSLTPLQRDLLAQAANELVAAQAPPPAPYADDLLGERRAPRGDSTRTDRQVPVQDGDVLDRDDPTDPEDR